ncbi:single-stranded DNA-binding protein [Clostridium coskatii]|uniref:Single-stranded DNA-binding protein n=1 Tax=Clostridium coskatii TaxID=1705578 RepID=A0A166T0W2_9CLOT|nr:single-stranded DNA-binding protein [Clostridium coskatii]OAA93030.1 Single-stranded DNA-binding protein ssb [Clostridium coskatii]OBR90425.1 single-stranded DNA-binding protein A [Clostridium coskatii]
MNRVVLIGRLTKDPGLQFLPGNGTAVTKFTLAVDRRFKKEGQQEADFVPIVVWNKQAESAANYLAKGRLVGIAGRIQTRNYEAKDGTRRYVTEVVADEVQFLEWGDKANSNSSQNTQQSNNSDGYTEIDDEGDIPFKIAVSQAA